MTQLSDSHDSSERTTRPNRATSLVPSHVARALHGCTWPVVRLVLASMLVGCIIPPSLSSGNPDAAQDAAPAIVSVEVNSQVLPEFSSVLFEMPQSQPMILGLLDTDLDDTLYVSMFVDYDPQNPKPPRATCTTPPSGAALRTSPPCSMQGICEAENLNTPSQLEIVVFDRMPLDTGTPLYMALPPGGLSATRVYTLNCVKPS